MIVRFVRDSKLYEITEYDVDGIMVYLNEKEKMNLTHSKEGECLSAIVSPKNRRKESKILERLTTDKEPIRFSKV